MLPVIDKSGSPLSLVKTDTSGNIWVAMKLAPDRKKFMGITGGEGEQNPDMGKFCENFSSFLQEKHKFLVRVASVGMDDMKA
ncbi:hypothetical protein Tsubulata_013454 [Turnera subulata]|uniref:Uncharacterized protein n=1 Tax=Turnera subulata TaxID=218843 RepID=A0A9Q0JJH4_9ROSI|nr:hypothetical protein Tsubulata_013454 [Turnera subulata]